MKIDKAMTAGLLASIISIVPVTRAATVTLMGGDSIGSSSFNSAGNWSNGAAPSGANDYVVGVTFLRTPAVNNSAYTFGGNSLTIASGGAIIIKSGGTSTLTVDDMILENGGYIRSGVGSSDTTVWDGNIMISGTGGAINADQNPYVIDSDISGTGDLTLGGGYSITLNGTNAMTGDIIVSSGTKTFSSTSVSIFTIGADGINNAITGSGAAFNGVFVFDLSAAGTTLGDSWTVTTAGASFGGTFSVDGFADQLDGTWKASSNGMNYEFDTATGLLTVAAEEGDLEFGIVSPPDGAVGVSALPVIEAVILDALGEIDTASVVMSLDGAPVVSSLVHTDGTSTVSYAVSVPMEDWSVHTAKVVAASTLGNAYSNEWSFTVNGPNIVATTEPKNFATLSPDGGWCWYSDPRALFHNGRLFYGYVRPSNGKTILDVFDLSSGENTNLWVSDFTQVDDHNVPGLCAKQDGSMLATYARHISDQFFAYRTSGTSPELPSDWTAEQRIADSGYGMTYANPFELTSEGNLIYNFCRNYNFNPTVYTSSDGGSSWSAPQQLIAAGTGGVRPYVKYCSDGVSRIDFLYTDGHPRDINNSLYHMYYEDGSFYETDGTLIKAYASLPLNHDSGERGSVIYQYSSAAQSDPNQWIPSGRAWCWETANDAGGYPVSVFTVQKDLVAGSTSGTDDRIYYYYARWTGSAWQKRFIAHAGRPLYNAEDDYAGGICVDPENPNVIYISSNSEDPFNLSLTNTGLRENDRYEIWKGVSSDGGLTFDWEQITKNSAVDNLRPYIPRRNGGESSVLWFRGVYNTYSSYSSDMVGLFTTDVPVPPPSAPITYADASSGAGGNTMEWNGAAWDTFNPSLNIGSDGDDQWEEETGSGWGNGPTENWFEANREGTSPEEDCPQLRTTVAGLADNVYDVYAYFWAAGGQGFVLGASLTGNPAGSLPVHTPSSAGVASANAAAFTTDVSVSSADRTLYQISLGTVTGSVINVYIDDEANGGYDSSVWYDGIGYRLHLATLPANIDVAADTGDITVSWPESHKGWVLQSRATLTNDWQDVGGSTTDTSWSIPGAGLQDSEFFRIRYPIQ